MKTKLYLTFVLLIFTLLGYSQPGEIDNSFNLSGVGAYGGSLPPAYQPNADGLVYKTDVYNEASTHRDKIIIIGRFTSYNGEPREYIARINADGSLDTGWVGPNLSTGYLYCVKILPDNKILIGGSFSIGTYRNVARLNADGTIDNTFNAAPSGVRGTNSEVHAIAVQPDNKILIGGVFTTFNGSGNRRLIRLNDNGTLDSTFNTVGTPNGEVRAIAIQKVGANANKILVGGFFDGWTGTSNTGHLIRVLPNGDLDTTFNPGGTGVTGGSAVFDIIVKPGSDSFFAVGKFNKFNGVTRNCIVFLKKDAETLINTVSAGANFTIFSAKFQPDGQVLLGGNFTSYGGVTIPKGITRISAIDATRDTSFLTGSGFTGGTGVYEGVSVIRDIVLQSDGKIIVSGDYTEYDTTPRRMISRIKTRECPFSAIYSSVWKDGISISATTTNYYVSIVSGTYTIPTGSHFAACELEIKDGAHLIIQPGASLTVNGIVMNNGHFTIQDTGALVQIKEDTKNADLGAGILEMHRNTSPLKTYDFVYWSSPVEDQTLHALSPLTRPDKYYKFDPTINNWVEINGGYETMVEGKGYIVRSPLGHTVGTPYNASFSGRAHNGKITIPILNSASNLNLIGNPYPSAIDAKVFLNDAANVGKIGGTLYLWSHVGTINNTNPGSAQYNYSDDYIAYNSLGATTANPTLSPFNGKIAAGQGFFVQSIVPTGVATFNNVMRLKDQNSQFYKADATASGDDNRLWLNLTNENGVFKQQLLGFTEGATYDLDRNYDAESMESTFIDFYSIVNNSKLTIQGRPLPLEINQVVPLGYTTNVAGTFKISLHQFDGLFQNQTVYLVDKLTNSVQEIKTAAYTFTTTAGTFNNRFELKFTDGTLSTTDMIAADDSATILTANDKISIKATQNIDSITAYDVTGKLLYNKKGINALNFTTENLNVQNQMVMVIIKFTNNQTLTKKVLIN